MKVIGLYSTAFSYYKWMKGQQWGKNTQQQSNLSELSEYLLTQKRNQKTDLNLFYVEKKKAFGKQTPVPNLSIIIKLTVQGRENQ